MKRIFGYVVKYWWIYALGLLTIIVSVGLDMFNPYLTGEVIDKVIEGGNTSVFRNLAIALMLVTIGRVVLGYGKEILFDFAGVNITTSLRQDLFDHIQSLSYNFFDQKNTGELMARVKEDAEHVWYGISFGIMLVVEIIINLIVVIIIMFKISPLLSVLALITTPLLGYFAAQVEKQIGKTYEEISEQNAALNSTAQENLAGIRLVKAFAREKHEVSKFLEQNKEYYRLNVRQAKIWSVFYPRMEFLSNTLPILVITFGGAVVVKETLSIGELVMFMGYMNMLIWPMRIIGWLSNVMAEARASAKKIEDVFAHESEIKNKENPISKEKIEGKVEFKNVSLTLNDTKVLDDISFAVDATKTLAIMGETGSGKSSIINLLTRFVDTTKGKILIDDIEVKDYDVKNLRGHLSVVMQEVFLFSDTIEENMKFGRKEHMDREEMIGNSKSAQAHDFIDRMEEEYNTVIGEKGLGLSGGQKQRISIARAFAKTAEVLILDDATSALDMETEYRIQRELNKLENKTKIIIAHRISAVKDADEILILEEGKIVERGTHKELLEQKGRYFETYKEQYEGIVA